MLEIVQLSDCHLYADGEREIYGSNPWQRLERTLDALRYHHRRARLMLLTGDLADEGEEEAYRSLARAILPLGMPAYAVPGNHDRPEAMRRALAESPIRFARTMAVGGWNLIFLDSTIPGETEGRLAERELVSLDKCLLERRAQPSLLVIHHPPISVNSPWLDRIGFANPEDLYAVMDRHPQVKGVVFGHAHQPVEASRNQVHFLGCPSTATAFAPGSLDFALDDKPPAYRWLRLHPGGRLESGVVYAREEPYPNGPLRERGV